MIQGDYIVDTSKHNGSVLNGAPNPAPEYIPPPPPPLSEEALLLNDNYRQNEDNKFAGKSSYYFKADTWNFDASLKFHSLFLCRVRFRRTDAQSRETRDQDGAYSETRVGETTKGPRRQNRQYRDPPDKWSSGTGRCEETMRRWLGRLPKIRGKSIGYKATDW